MSGPRRAIGYPTNRLLAVIDDAAAAASALAELQAAGFATRDLDVLRGEEGADRMDGTGGVSGWLGRLRRAFDFTLMDQLVDSRPTSGRCATAGPWSWSTSTATPRRRRRTRS